MSQVFELSAALSLDTEDFVRDLRSAETAARQFQSTLDSRMRAAAAAMSRFQATSGGVWSSVAAGIQQATASLQRFLAMSGQTVSTRVQGFATGLDYVPYNNYPARLHEGEAVLTKLEADRWRQGEMAASVDPAALTRALTDALSGVTVQLDGEAVGTLVAPAVSRQIARRTTAGRYR